MKKYIHKIIKILIDISYAFTGTYSGSDDVVDKMKEDLIKRTNESMLLGFRQDKKRMKEDMNHVAGDLRRAIDKYNLKHG